MVEANFNGQSIQNNGYKYWVDLGWKETGKKEFHNDLDKNNILSFDKIENVKDDEILQEDDLDFDWEDFGDE